MKLRHVERAADLLLSELELFFVAPGVGVMLHFGLIGREALPITVPCLAAQSPCCS
ncbi:MAG TPA: CidA/LrgA family protein [Planctomycetota bacterium]|nr:CidA/LrgA family protein [Planctomycetota bacterium]